LCFTGQYSLFQQAAARLSLLNSAHIDVAPPLLVAGEEHRFLAVEQLRETGITLGHALLEPVGRNTAPALTLAAFAAQAEGQDPILVVTPADQSVADGAAFTRAMQKAIHEAASGTIVILGVTPDRPETGYGYIQAAEYQAGVGAALHVKRFVEKPDARKAQSYLDAGGYFWNAGMFVLRASVWLKALELIRPDILQASRSAWIGRREDGHFIRPGLDAFNTIPAESIDYAVIEHATSAGLPIMMVPLNAGWSDLGSWDAVWGILPKDFSGNAHVGDVLIADSRNNFVHASSRLVSLVGVEDLIVIETPDAILVANRTRSQDLKHIVNTLKNQGREEHVLHRKVHRPWGWYDSIDQGGRFKVKRIQVKPGASLSLQQHHHRAEHWVVVSGTAEIINGDKKLLLSENQSTYIPLGQMHRLSNPGSIPLEIIEVQSGSYLGEDDIVRFEDNYGRKT
jgi:mannose-1-phosphate guanylyltransferase/mannose-6-phosphate isomerase